MSNLEERTAEYQEYIENYLDKHCFQYETEPQKKLFSSVRYSLLAGGKRLRPILVFEFCRLCGGNWKEAAPFAAGIEMIHTYSLIHDDLPCMDNDDYRRGRLTNHKVYGEAMAVLAGDALLTEAFTVLPSASYPAETNLQAVQILSACAGAVGMVGGQVLDMESEERTCTEQEVLDIQVRKTGALIRAACMLGVCAGQGSQAQLSAAADFATNLGLAFQIRDDMLDVIGSQQELGKAVGVDDSKNTFVRLYGLKKCDEFVKLYTENALKALDAFEDTDYLRSLSKSMTQRMH